MPHRRPPKLLGALALAVALLATPAAASAQTDDPEPQPLWATVNVCDTAAHPDTIGIRGSMPGTGRSEDRMFMRFTVQYQAADGTWKPLSTGGDSGWESIGRGTWEARQSGYSFQVAPVAGLGAPARSRPVPVAALRARRAPRGPRDRGGSPLDGGRRSAQLVARRLRRHGVNSRGSFVMMPSTPSATRLRTVAASSTVHT